MDRVKERELCDVIPIAHQQAATNVTEEMTPVNNARSRDGKGPNPDEETVPVAGEKESNINGPRSMARWEGQFVVANHDHLVFLVRVGRSATTEKGFGEGDIDNVKDKADEKSDPELAAFADVTENGNSNEPWHTVARIFKRLQIFAGAVVKLTAQ